MILNTDRAFGTRKFIISSQISEFCFAVFGTDTGCAVGTSTKLWFRTLAKGKTCKSP